MKHFFPGLAEN